MSDPIADALARSDTLDDPNVLKEDRPPMLRFERRAVEDRHVTTETGRHGWKDQIIVHVKSLGDVKTEVPYVVWEEIYVPTFETVMVRKAVPIKVRLQDKDGSFRETEIKEERDEAEERATYTKEEKWEWFEQLDENLRAGRISQNYRDHCRKAFDVWRQKGEMPIDGTPIVTWNMISPAQQKQLLECDINTIEKAAEMTEDTMEQVGMGSRDIKRKAMAFVGADTAPEKQAADIVDLNTRLESERERNSSLEAKVADLEAMIQEE